MNDKVVTTTSNDGARSTGNSSTSRRPPKGVVPPGFKPFAPGQSGNPAGRPQMSPEVKAALAGASLDAVKKQIELMQCGDARIELMASQALLDRYYGKAAQQVDTNITTTTTQQAHLQILVGLQAKRDDAAAKVIELDAEVEDHKTLPK